MKELKKYLIINAVFSAISGSCMLVFWETINEIFNINNAYVFPFIGANLLVFALFVWYVSSKKTTNNIFVMIITTLDVLWVLGSILIVLFDSFYISKIGNGIIIAVAIWIAFLGFQQYKNSQKK